MTVDAPRLILLGLSAIAALAVLLSVFQKPGETPAREAAHSAPSEARADDGIRRMAGPALPDPDPQSTFGATTNSAQETIDAYWARLESGDRLSAFLENNTRERADARRKTAEALFAQISAQEQNGELIAAQALFLKSAIVKSLYADEPELVQAELAALDDTYAERTRLLDLAPPDSRFAAYKKREQEILAEIDAAASIPGGLSREDYLTRRLDEARFEIYEDTAAP